MIQSIEQAVILYAPTVLLYLTQIIDWFVTLKKFKALDIQSQITPVLKRVDNVSNKIETLEKDIRKFQKDKLTLSSEIEFLTATVGAQNQKLEDLKEYLKVLSQENIELKAELRRKADEE